MVAVLLFSLHSFGSTRIHPDPLHLAGSGSGKRNRSGSGSGSEARIKVDPDPDPAKCSGSGSGSETLIQTITGFLDFWLIWVVIQIYKSIRSESENMSS